MLVHRLGDRGISVTGVTKATLGSIDIAATLLQAGVRSIGDSRIENIESMRAANVTTSMTLIRSPMLSQTHRVVDHVDVSFNTEIAVIRRLSQAAQEANRLHGIVLMVELGDLREGIMPEDLERSVKETLCLPNIEFRGIGTNLACRSGVSPDADKMSQMTEFTIAIEKKFGMTIDVVSGGNSANLQWALGGQDVGRINDLRLGESILLGREPLHRQPIDGLYTNAITLSAEVIESKCKPSLPWGNIAQTAFGEPQPTTDRGPIPQTILAIGLQDIDPCGLVPPPGVKIVGASSDHLIIETRQFEPNVGAEIEFQLNYSSLLRAMTSPYVAKVMSAVRTNRTEPARSANRCDFP